MLLDNETLKALEGTALEKPCSDILKFNLYCTFLKPDPELLKKTLERFSFAPDDYLKWCKVCGGGTLQDVDFLCEKGFDKAIGFPFPLPDYDQYEERCRKEGVTDEYYVFAVANFGDYFCFRKADDGTKDGKVYQWGLHEGEVVLEWDNFADWFTEQVEDWVLAIADDELDPIPVNEELE